VISSIVSRFDAVLVDVPGGFIAPLGLALQVRLISPVRCPIFRRDCVFATAGGALAFSPEIDDVAHASDPKIGELHLRRRKTDLTPVAAPALECGTRTSRRQPCGKLMHDTAM
jgi:hypothetical protein